MGTTQTPFQELLKKEVTRKEFLVYLGIAMLAVLNIEPILRMLGKYPNASSGRISGLAGDNYGGRKREID